MNKLARRTRRILANPWVRLGLSVVVLAIAGVLLGRNGELLTQGWHHLSTADPRWLAAAVVFMAATMISQAEVMVVLLRGADVPVRRSAANILGLAANAWSASLPGGPAVSAAMIFREQRRWGATQVVAGWYMLLSGVLAASGMAILGLLGVFFLGAHISLPTLVASLLGLGAAIGAINWAAHHPGHVLRLAQRVLARVNKLRHLPAHHGAHRLRERAEELATVRLSPARLATAMAWSLAKWVAEIGCLWACAISIGAQPTLAGITLAFLAAKLVGQAQITPGGLGPVDVALTSALVPFAAISAAHAVAAAIIFRLISFVGLTIVGWLVFCWFWTIRGTGSTGRR
ncbi:lysylphosphatidylglycerol synthase transmembrane domain-containing protein [Corynebacterium uberis]|uniref:lysylphosphatidylglycerol synthase transmembrane domain-containing protein n=1 Tax=Corynebacterium TaxID=1716 RepID=UPI001D0A2D23|nr:MULTISPECIES: YbhN family protein [Corynebacterium]MCZ9309613.1 YbhN family protein [Corynebacterium sp. c6VSa_13]UDL73420.1 YbhN family protein [Corynebacterium uberis]UDL75700.1 YbhN family protein [Corynebacterium uberis]UDL77913.1 YbhN family protein [Corynebacterium uberis]UDL80196.1 YbhN family protein [Corynebacterium uberis]